MNAYNVQTDPALARSADSFAGLGNGYSRVFMSDGSEPQADAPTRFTEAELMAKHQRGIEAIEAGKGIRVTMAD